MNCIQCRKEVPEGSVFCNHCGKKLVTKKKRRPRHGNGSGSVYKIKGNRRKPWAALTPGYWNGEKYERHFIGYFETEKLAREAIRKVSPRSLKETYSYTVKDVYEAWKETHYRTLQPKTKTSYDGAWRYMEPLEERKMRDVRKEDLQQIINGISDSGKSRSLCENVKKLMSQLCKWAVDNEIIPRNYAERLALPAEVKGPKRVFTPEEIQKIETMIFDKRLGETARITLTMIYTGMRIGEITTLEQANIHLDKGYMVGGIKTDAGRDRLIPVHSKVRPYIEQWLRTPGKYLIQTSTGNCKSTDNVRKSFNSMMNKLEIEGAHPHACRRTYGTMLAKNGIRPEVITKLMGHVDYSTSEIYIETDLEDLLKASGKI